MPLSPPLVLEVGIVLQVPTPSALPHTWTLKWVYKELGSATIKVNNNNLFEHFETPHVNSNMFDICRPNCLICSLIHDFHFSSSTCPKITHYIWWVPCRRIYIIKNQVFDKSWKHRAWIETFTFHLFGPRGSIVDFPDIATLCYSLLSMKLIKG
jgi:hypothetical protein